MFTIGEIYEVQSLVGPGILQLLQPQLSRTVRVPPVESSANIHEFMRCIEMTERRAYL